MKKKGYVRRKEKFERINMKKKKEKGLIVGIMQIKLGFEMIWNIWWMEIEQDMEMLVVEIEN